MIYVNNSQELYKSLAAAECARKRFETAKIQWEKEALLYQTQSLAFALQKAIIDYGVDEIMYLGYLTTKVDISRHQLLDPGHYFDYKHSAKNIGYTGIDLKKVAATTPYKSQVANFSAYEKRLNTLYPDFSELLDHLNSMVNNLVAPQLLDNRKGPFLTNLRGRPLTSDIKVIMEALMTPEDYNGWSIVCEKDMLLSQVANSSSISNNPPTHKI